MKDNSMWCYKYQPTSISECIIEGLPAGTQELVHHLLQKRERPNLLLCGSPGTGKSTIARIICHAHPYSRMTFEGFELTKEKVVDLPRSLSTCTLFGDVRIVWIEEADGITEPAQQVLRTLIDPKFNASWILTCNDSNALIEPLRSRFMRIDFALPRRSERPKHEAAIVRYCRHILDSEGIDSVSDAEIFAVVESQYPDIRATINELQRLYFPRARAE